MEQLLLHMIGDYITQTNWMAAKKRTNAIAASFHAVVYAAPFFLLTKSLDALTIIYVTHFLIDHHGLARYVVFTKNWLNEPHLKWRDCKATGYPLDVPPWLAVWLLIIADNTMHLCINYAAIRWL